MTESVPGPSGAGTVILDLGADIGALVLDTPAGLLGQEIEISLVGSDPAARRTHSMVRERKISSGTGYAAVYPDLPAGDYTVWRDAVTAAVTVTIVGGRVTRCRWPDGPA
jgi:hypothetical protein